MMPKEKLERLQSAMERRNQRPWRRRRTRSKAVEPVRYARINAELLKAVMELVPANARTEFAYCLAKKILDEAKEAAL